MSTSFPDLYRWRVVKDGYVPGPASRIGKILPSPMSEETARLREQATGEVLQKVFESERTV